MYCTFILIHKAFEGDSPYVACRGRFTRIERRPSDETFLERLFEATNNIDSSWTTMPHKDIEFDLGEKVQKQGGCRSTSVGDEVTLMDWNGRDARTYECSVIGWKKIEKATKAA